MEAQDDFFKRVTCDSRFDYIRERMQNRVTKQAAESRPLKGIEQSVRNNPAGKRNEGIQE